ncbi:hypothetical protein L6452_23788 [Arctium lappa]|uniref:Uncharacterized protein n=1 Tax=Arctium lappa TaxID=4217 RepID=A0ACB9A7U6_ARCLA|nr:hypothetical protein L6452_23788 [Arctium lappa]
MEHRVAESYSSKPTQAHDSTELSSFTIMLKVVAFFRTMMVRQVHLERKLAGLFTPSKLYSTIIIVSAASTLFPSVG